MVLYIVTEAKWISPILTSKKCVIAFLQLIATYYKVVNIFVLCDIGNPKKALSEV